MKQVLVTGANGQLGLAIKAATAAYPELSFVFAGKKELDVTSPGQIEVFFKANRFDFCINAAAYTQVDKAEDEPEAAYLLNETAPRLLAEACKKHGVFLIHISTDYVFDGTKGSPYTAEDRPNPINVYGASKLAGEQALAAVGGDYCIVRTSWLYSEYGNNFQTKILAKAKTAPYLEVVSDLYGTPTYAPNLVVFLLNKINDLAFTSNVEHFSGGKTMSWYDLAKSLTQIQVKEIASETLNLKANRPKDTALLNNLNE
ncbi:MAG: dTDP-4-dehydrorhamnose reductase [Flavobacteriaceae bacterium]|nr:dTDP-4-dehydrorhamnose reductase [Flavobacteriaceae bacterium]